MSLFSNYWNNLTILGVALSTTLVSILVNAFSSLYLCRMLRRDRMLANKDEEMAGLRGGREGGVQASAALTALPRPNAISAYMLLVIYSALAHGAVMRLRCGRRSWS